MVNFPLLDGLPFRVSRVSSIVSVEASNEPALIGDILPLTIILITEILALKMSLGHELHVATIRASQNFRGLPWPTYMDLAIEPNSVLYFFNNLFTCLIGHFHDRPVEVNMFLIGLCTLYGSNGKTFLHITNCAW